MKHVVSVSGGKDSTALLALALERCPAGSVVPIFCDTGHEHEAVYAYLEYLEQRFGVAIKRLRADFTEEIAAKRMFIARDQRTGREYDTIKVFEADGTTPVPKRDGFGRIVTRKATRNGVTVVEAVQKTKKIGGGRRVRWTNKAKRRALEVLHPTGNAFLDLCLWKGRFPSRTAQFCTEQLKRNMAVAFQLDLVDSGHRVISWQGVRRDESPNRRHAKLVERIGPRMWAFRPLVDWTAAQVFDYCREHGIEPNPLYKQGMSRVGCMPCINVNKDELREIARRFPAHIERVAEWELLVGKACKRGFSTLRGDSMADPDLRRVFDALNINAAVEWSKTSRGGRQFSLLDDLIDGEACASAYGLCE